MAMKWGRYCLRSRITRFSIKGDQTYSSATNYCLISRGDILLNSIIWLIPI